MSSIETPIVHQGHPLDPNRGSVLSADDEKRIDDKGRPIALGLLWSKATTGLYLIVAVTKGDPKIDRKLIGGAQTVVRKAARLTVGVTFGRPRLSSEFWGAALELPSDLGRDRVKQKYVAEWLRDTTLEALEGAGHPVSGKGAINQLGLWVANTSNDAINAAGL